jgi:hypothetical protein
MFGLNYKKFRNRDIRNDFDAINKRITMLYSEGSVEIQMGLYETEKDIQARIDRIGNYQVA